MGLYLKFRSTAKFLLIVLVLLACAELYLRFYWGFCDSVLLQENDKYEYIAQPNQERFRFRHKIKYNSYSMRSEEPDSSAFKILGFGDSVINGSAVVDQDSVVTSLLTKHLTHLFHQPVQVLNISAGSWGPDNCYAYLKEHGDFDAEMMFIVLSSHDAYDNMDFRTVVDKVRGYESEQYKLALWELTYRYIIPRITNGSKKKTPGVIKSAPNFNTGIMDFKKYTGEHNIPFFVYLHPDTTEIGMKKYNVNGQEIIKLCAENNIPCIQALDIMDKKDYRDVIHLKEAGHRKMFKRLNEYIAGYIKENQLLHN